MSGVTVSRKYSDHMQSPVKHSVDVYYEDLKDRYPGPIKLFFFFLLISRVGNREPVLIQNQ